MRSEAISILSIVTFVLWFGCSVIGGIGSLLSYPSPQPQKKTDPPIKAEMIKVELSSDPSPPSPTPAAAPTENMQPPALTAPPQVTQPAAMVEVAAPDTVAFAVPVVAPVRIVEAKNASYAASASMTSNTGPVAGPPVQTLTFGQGEGKQPAPDYPRRSIIEGQEGTVIVRFMVGENGRVLAAEASTRSPWSLLNEAAVRVVREKWHFQSGNSRVFEVSIRFELQK